ncbi:hypothetical protein Vadar_024750 [Vaccinium darrowii]|uniref:Uncharacterized protein n=1 Tax=Vaccinium darrowii TaxID=229202 RepID=A0ACB7X466_9ERIC|nr:hypothetical protein Vadar_024750 [Vaccinium darrowii]
MAIFNFQVILYSLSIIFCFLFPQTHSLSFNLKNIGREHGSLNITAFPFASISSKGLQLTTADKSGNMQQQAGKATYNDLLHLWDKSTGKLTDFETHFVFVIDSDGSESFADGLTFFLEDPIGQIIQQNVGWDPVNTSPITHVGIDVNSLKSNVTAPWYCNVTHGIENEAWIRYESRSHKLSVVFTGSTNTTRVKDTIHLTVDLRDYLPEWVTFGFSAATGALFEKHTVKSWEFSSSLYV